MEDLLLDIFKGPMRVAWVLGYFPLSIENGSLKFKPWSFPVIYSLIVMFFMLASPLYVSLGFEGIIQRNYRIEYGVVKAVYITDETATCLVGIYFKMAGFLLRNRMLSFWKLQVQLLENFQKEGLLEGCEQETIMRKLRQASKSCTYWINMILTVICHAALAGLVGYLSFKPPGEDDILEPARTSALHFILVVFAIYSMCINNFCHPGFEIWPVTFIKVYSALYEVLNVEIRHIKEMLRMETLATKVKHEQAWVLEAFRKTNQEEDRTTGGALRQKIETCLTLLSGLEDEIMNFNRSFGAHLLIEFSYLIVKLVTFGFYYSLTIINVDIKTLYLLLAIIIPIILLSWSLYSFGTVASALTQHAERTSRSLELLPAYGLGIELRHRVRRESIHNNDVIM